jgi:hypothetical protein
MRKNESKIDSKNILKKLNLSISLKIQCKSLIFLEKGVNIVRKRDIKSENKKNVLYFWNFTF